MRTGIFVLSFAVGVAAASCGSTSSDSSGGGGGGATVAIDDVGAKIAATTCGIFEKCLGSFASAYFGGADCVTLQTRRFDDQSLAAIKAAIGKGTIVYHGEAVEACLAAFDAAGCSAFASRSPAACDGVFAGTKSLGDDCTVNEECPPQSYCKVASACPGKCSAREVSGAACSEDDACQDGLACDSGKCQKPGASGDACGSTAPQCGLGLVCAGSTTTTCKAFSDVATGAEGATCDAQAMSLCQDGLSCVLDGVNGSQPVWKCAKPYAAGAPCKVGFPASCPAGQACSADPKTGKIDGVCGPLPGEGEACLQLDGLPKCQPYMACDSDGKCKSIQGIGAACGASDSLCYSGDCSGGTCAAKDACKTN